MDVKGLTGVDHDASNQLTERCLSAAGLLCCRPAAVAVIGLLGFIELLEFIGFIGLLGSIESIRLIVSIGSVELLEFINLLFKPLESLHARI
jgi:hypothetical protein